jgi:hypothetical protein
VHSGYFVSSSSHSFKFNWFKGSLHHGLLSVSLDYSLSVLLATLRPVLEMHPFVVLFLFEDVLCLFPTPALALEFLLQIEADFETQFFQNSLLSVNVVFRFPVELLCSPASQRLCVHIPWAGFWRPLAHYFFDRSEPLERVKRVGFLLTRSEAPKTGLNFKVMS